MKFLISVKPTVTAGPTDLGNVYLQQRGGAGWGGVRRGFPVDPPRVQDQGSRVEQRRGLFTQLWGSAGPGEGEDVFRASLIMAAWEEINRGGPAGMLQRLPPAGGGGAWSARGRGGAAHRGDTPERLLFGPHLCGYAGL